jgi:simple sugar transport system ATP-binding protein
MSDNVMTTGRGPDSLSVRATGLTKTFGDKVALRGADFEMHKGEIHALLGENGAGKSTLISILCGQYRPDAGTVEVHGKVEHFHSPRAALSAGVGVVHQDFRLVPPFTVLENVVLGTPSVASKTTRKQCLDIVERVGFNLDLDRRVSDLAVGEKQQTEILKLLFRGLDILILDEPTAVLTPQQASQLFAALRTLADDGKAVAFVSHRLNEVAEAADHLTVLRHGEVVAERAAQGIRPAEISELMVGKLTMPSLGASERPPGAVVLSLAGVSTTGTARDSLHELDLEVRAGELVGVAGVSGNGQRHLAEVAAGILDPDTGTRTCQDETPAFVPEDRLHSGLVGSMSIAQNLALRTYRTLPMRQRLWLSPEEMARTAAPLISAFNIPTTDPALAVGGLSGGGQQRVILARELSRPHELLIAAQPSRGLDVASATAVQQRLLQTRDQGAAVLVISEDLDELLAVSDRIVVLAHGRIVREFTRAQADVLALGEAMTGAVEAEQSPTGGGD